MYLKLKMRLIASTSQVLTLVVCVITSLAPHLAHISVCSVLGGWSRNSHGFKDMCIAMLFSVCPL